MVLSDATLRLLRSAHVLAVVLFLGNVIVTGVWSALMFRDRRVVDFRVSARAIVVTDWIFTLGGAVLLVVTGVVMALGRGYPMWHTRWIREALIGLALSTALWVAVLIPAQRAMLRIAPADDALLVRTFRRWNVAGWIAVAPLLWSLWSMTYKPA